MTRFTYGVLIAIIIGWGFSWPSLKFDIPYLSPYWFTALRLSIATIIVFGATIFTKQCYWPRRQDLWLIISIAILQFVCFILSADVGLKYLTAERSVILAYSTPIWVTPIAIIFFNVKPSKLKILGLIFCIAGILLLFDPMSFDWHNTNNLIGNGILIFAAMAWSASILITRYSNWHDRTAFQLLPWQLLIASIILLTIAFYHGNWTGNKMNPMAIGSLLYNAVVATAFCYWGFFYVTKRLPVITTSLSLLAVPVLGGITSILLVGEPIQLNLVVAFSIMLVGIACGSIADAIKRKRA